MVIKERVLSGLTALVESLPSPRKSNDAKYYQEIFAWQEIAALAEDRMKAAWKEAQGPAAVIEADDDMRARGVGDHIVSEAGNFSCVAKVANEGQRFDKEAFVELAAKKLKVPPSKIMALMMDATKPSKAALQKRIMEA